MAFLSYGYALFLPIAVIVHGLIRNYRWQNLVLLAASLVFYGLYGLENLAVLVFCIALTYFGGMLGAKRMETDEKGGKRILICALILNLLVLAVFKYTGFAVLNLNKVLRRVHMATLTPPGILLPVGLSFYIFQSSTYLIDLMRGDVQVEKNPVTYGAFVSFFPTIVSGPILKSKEMLARFQERRYLTFRNFQVASIQFIWGAFLKKVIADRIAMFTNTIWNNYGGESGAMLLVAALFYSLQIYTDFYGYTCMAMGTARLLGFKLPENFTQPYFAQSMQDFWRRWHVSLSSWFTRYLYIPLGGNRKGRARQIVNTFIVFLTSGLWHGADWSFVLWGGLHAFFITAERPFLKKKDVTAAEKLVRILYTYLAASFAWIFFRAESIKQGIAFVRRIFSDFQVWTLVDGTLYTKGLSSLEWGILMYALLLLAVVSLLRERGAVSKIMVQPWWARYAVCFVLFFAIVIFGIYGPQFVAENFIYAGF